MFLGISPAQAADGEGGGGGAGGRLLGRGGDEPVEVDEGGLDVTRVVAGQPLRQFRGVHDLHLSSSPVRQLSELSAKVPGRHSIVVMNQDNPSRGGIADPWSDRKIRTYENKGAGLRELEPLGDDRSYRVSLRKSRIRLAFAPQRLFAPQ